MLIHHLSACPALSFSSFLAWLPARASNCHPPLVSFGICTAGPCLVLCFPFFILDSSPIPVCISKQSSKTSVHCTGSCCIHISREGVSDIPLSLFLLSVSLSSFLNQSTLPTSLFCYIVLHLSCFRTPHGSLCYWNHAGAGVSSGPGPWPWP